MLHLCRRMFVLAFVVMAMSPHVTFAVDIETIETEVGAYELLLFPMNEVPFELTENRELGVRAIVGGGNITKFEGFVVSDPRLTMGTFVCPVHPGWAIMGDQLVIGFQGEILTFSLPDLKEIRRQSLPSSETPSQRLTSRDSLRNNVARVRNGWQIDGSVYDNSGEKLRCLRFPRVSFIKAESSGLEFAGFSMLNRWPLYVTNKWGVLTLQDPQSMVVEPIFSPSLGELDSNALQNLRINNDNATFSHGKTAVHLRVKKFDTRKAGLQLPRRFEFSQPTFLLKDLAVDTPHHFVDGPDSPAMIHFGQPDAANSFPSDLSVDARANEFLDLMLEHAGKKQASVEETKAVIQNYLGELRSEYRRASGSSPQGIPIPIRVMARSLWYRTNPLSEVLGYWVWTDVPEDHLLMKRFPELLDSIRHKEQRKAEKIRNLAIDARYRLVRLVLSPLLLICGVVCAALIYRRDRALMNVRPEPDVKPKRRNRPPKPPLEELDVDL